MEDQLCADHGAVRQDAPDWPVADCGDAAVLAGPCSGSPDSDCDGVLDCQEAGFMVDTDDDGVPDAPAPDPCSGPAVDWEALATLRDTDADGVPDMFDRDDDGDGVPTRDELTVFVHQDPLLPACVAAGLAGGGLLGLPSSREWSWYCFGADAWIPVAPAWPWAVDSDGDLVVDYLDA
ncbi:MAG: hypothetical protein KC656_37735, partial [Myxococcales bacterium]|nr:hypothetical protein [Myxococcales bacterium]